MVIDKQIFDNLTKQAKESPRLRMAMDLRNFPEDGSQRMLNALEPRMVLMEAKNGKYRPLNSNEVMEVHGE